MRSAPPAKSLEQRVDRDGEKAECEHAYGELELPEVRAALQDGANELKRLAARCAGHLRSTWESQLGSASPDEREIAWILLEIYPTAAFRGAQAAEELRRTAGLAEQLANQPRADPKWEWRVAKTRARMMTPHCGSRDMKAVVELLKGTPSYDETELEVAKQLTECKKSLAESDPLAVESAGKAAEIYWFLGHRAGDPARKQELLSLAVEEGTFVFERRHQHFPTATPNVRMLGALLDSLFRLKRDAEARGWVERLLQDARFTAAHPEMEATLREVRFDALFDHANHLADREDFKGCAQVLSELEKKPPRSRSQKLETVRYNLGICHEAAGEHALADKAWRGIEDRELRRRIKEKRALRAAPKSP